MHRRWDVDPRGKADRQDVLPEPRDLEVEGRGLVGIPVVVDEVVIRVVAVVELGHVVVVAPEIAPRQLTVRKAPVTVDDPLPRHPGSLQGQSCACAPR
jgi:hypothetical protein